MKIVGTLMILAALVGAALTFFLFFNEYRSETRIITKAEERAASALKNADTALRSGKDSAWEVQDAERETAFVRHEKDVRTTMGYQLLGMAVGALVIGATGARLLQRRAAV
jgi:hypothetical protein